MKDFFKPDDFTSAIKYSTHDEECKKKCADACNRKLNALIESWPEVVGQIKNIDGGLTNKKYWCATQIPNNGETHKARLAFIEEIVKEPCKHENILTYVTSLTGGPAVPVILKDKFKCNNCGIELTPTWSIKDGK